MASKTVAPITTILSTPSGRGKYQRTRLGAVTWLAASLGVSRQHANRLFQTGRVVGAVKLPTGVWDLPPGFVEVIAGTRGPRRTVEDRVAAKQRAARNAARRQRRLLKGGQS